MISHTDCNPLKTFYTEAICTKLTLQFELGILNFLSVSFDAQETSRIFLLYACNEILFTCFIWIQSVPPNARDWYFTDDVIYFFLSFSGLRRLSAALRRDRWKCFRIIGGWIYCFWIKDHFLASERTTKWLQRDESQSCLNFYITNKDASESLL